MTLLFLMIGADFCVAKAGGFMKRRQLAASAILLALVGIFPMQTTALSVIPAHGDAQAHKPAPQASGSSAHTVEEPQALHRKCTEAAKRLRYDVLTMEPGRAWRWRLDSERSRQQIVGLRHDLREFWEAEAAFEASLPANQKSKFNPQFVRIHNLFEHLDRDAQSLDTELKKGYPTRWHVDRDVTDMRKEINRWKKEHERIAEGLGLKE